MSFTRDTVAGLAAADYKDALVEATTKLVGKRNVLFDLHNEINATGLPPADAAHPTGLTYSQWEIYMADTIKPAVAAADPARLLTVSFGSNDRRASYIKGAGFNVAELRDDLADAPAKTMPVYFQEPNRFGSEIEKDNDYTHYLTAVANAKTAGAAAWTFHNDPTKDLDGSTPFYDLLQPSERTFLNSLQSTLASASWLVASPRRFPVGDFDGAVKTDLSVSVNGR